MKFFVILIVSLPILALGAGLETFDNCTVGSGYSDGSFSGEGGITWSYVQSRDENGDENGSGIDGNALMLRRSSDNSKVTSGSIAGGIGDFSVKLYKGFTGGGDRQVELYVNSVSKGTSTAFDDFDEHTFSVSGINITGSITIELRNVTAKQVIVDDISWTSYSGSGSPDPEPSNHVSSFSASADGHDQIDLSWSDNDGAQAADGHLILVNTTGSFNAPVDGTAQSDDTDLSDNAGVKNVSSGTESYSFTGLNEETTYYFKIWPYTNSGEDIDYKTDGIVPTDNATTGSAPAIPAVLISEVADPGDQPDGRFVELYNAEGTSVDLTGWSLRRYANANTSSQDVTLSGTMAAGEVIVISYEDESDFNALYGVSTDFSNGSVITGNGDDTYELYNGSVVVDIYGEVGTDGTGEDWEYEDSRAVRSGVTSGNQTWTASEWTITSANVADCTPGELDNDQSLPVTLSTWTATSKGGVVELQWTTASEIENQGFIIARKGNEREAFVELSSFSNNPDLLGQGSGTRAQTYAFTDRDVTMGETYSYRLSDVAYSGEITHHAVVSVTVTALQEVLLPRDIALGAAYPNPFNPVVHLDLNLAVDALSPVNVNVFDLQGRQVASLLEGQPAAGTTPLSWDGTDLSGQSLGSGIYLVRLETTGIVQIQRVTLLR